MCALLFSFIYCSYIWLTRFNAEANIITCCCYVCVFIYLTHFETNLLTTNLRMKWNERGAFGKRLKERNIIVNSFEEQRERKHKMVVIWRCCWKVAMAIVIKSKSKQTYDSIVFIGRHADCHAKCTTLTRFFGNYKCKQMGWQWKWWNIPMAHDEVMNMTLEKSCKLSNLCCIKI